jgi:hypothetical protein
MKKLMLIALLVLTGCSTVVPVTQKFPDVPDELKQACPDLEQVPAGTTKLSDVLVTVTDNYSQYHECRIKVDTWIRWYTNQQKIFNDVSK